MAERDSIVDIIAFWREAGPEKWFAKDDGFDAAIRARFGEATGAALAGGFDGWRCCSTSFPAICFAARRAPSRATPGRARSPARRWRGGSTSRSSRRCASSRICPSCIRKTSPIRN